MKNYPDERVMKTVIREVESRVKESLAIEAKGSLLAPTMFIQN